MSESLDYLIKSVKGCSSFIWLQCDDFAPKPPLETDCRRCCARILCGLLCSSRAQGECLRESARCGYGCFSIPALRHIGFAAGNRYRLPDLETFSQYEVDSCSSDIPSRHICNCNY